MAEAVTSLLSIHADWERLERGTPEECACFSALGIRYGATWLTQAEDAFVNRVRNKVHLSAYRLAQWFAWNWWRLRWEPRRTGEDWALAHRLATTGGGYVWPNITTFSDGERVDNSKLSQMAGVQSAVLTTAPSEGAALSFALDDSDTASRVVLRSKWEAGRRFDLASILGDRITAPDNRLFPATRAYTYRQKLQRSFAPEFLCSFEALDALLSGDYSEDAQRDAAEHFQLSELMVSTILVNYGRVDRSDVEKDAEITAAA
jgi:hypothetical protein